MPARPADQKRHGMQGAGVQRDQHRRQGLADPDAAQKLQLDGVGALQRQHEEQRPQLHHKGDELGDLRLRAAGVQSGCDEVACRYCG